MKILHIICATLMAVAFTSCDEHRYGNEDLRHPLYRWQGGKV